MWERDLSLDLSVRPAIRVGPAIPAQPAPPHRDTVAAPGPRLVCPSAQPAPNRDAAARPLNSTWTFTKEFPL
jgi:hypothetical protein